MVADWEARAQELSCSAPSDWSTLLTVADALQLGREMAEEAADARAEEIAKELDLRSRSYGKVQPTNAAECHICAAIARSFKTVELD